MKCRNYYSRTGVNRVREAARRLGVPLDRPLVRADLDRIAAATGYAEKSVKAYMGYARREAGVRLRGETNGTLPVHPEAGKRPRPDAARCRHDFNDGTRCCGWQVNGTEYCLWHDALEGAGEQAGND